MSGQSPGIRGGEGPSSLGRRLSSNRLSSDGLDDEEGADLSLDRPLLRHDTLGGKDAEVP